MKNIDLLISKFNKAYSPLSDQEIQGLNESDNGPLNNVISAIQDECIGVHIFTKSDEIIFKLFYINGAKGMKGHLIQIKYDDPDYVDILFHFCNFLVHKFEDLNVIDIINCFQGKVLTLLEKAGFRTITSLFFEEYDFGGKHFEMIDPRSRGIKIVYLFDKIKFYKSYMNFTDVPIYYQDKEYTYLMLNSDTNLFKIGRSKNPSYRERTLHSQEPQVSLIASWETSTNVEKELHRMFSEKRKRGEYFRLNLIDLKKINEYMKQYL